MSERTTDTYRAQPVGLSPDRAMLFAFALCLASVGMCGTEAILREPEPPRPCVDSAVPIDESMPETPCAVGAVGNIEAGHHHQIVWVCRCPRSEP